MDLRLTLLFALAVGCASTGLDQGEIDARAEDAGGEPDVPGVDFDSAVRVDAGWVDAGDAGRDADAGPVVPPTCAPEAIVDLDEEGEWRGDVLHYFGTNVGASVESSVFVRGSPGTMTSALAMSFTPRIGTRLLLSIANPGTDPEFFPRIWVLDRCTEEVTRQLHDSQPPGGPYTGPSEAVLAGVPLTIVVAGRIRQLTGNFELTVHELPIVEEGDTCDLGRVLENTCSRTTACVGEGFAPPEGVCMERGLANGNCRLDPPYCDPGFSCSGSPISPRAICLPSVEPGRPCREGVCAAGSYCALGTCTARGTLENQCRTDRTCDVPLVCDGSSCRPIARLGEECSPSGRGPKCQGEQSCVGRVCVLHGSEGADCLGAEQTCDTGLRCRREAFGGRDARCLVPAETGEECRARSCREGASCRGFTCVADGTSDGLCRSTGAPCDEGLSCAEVRFANLSLNNTCQPVFVGGPCQEPPNHACPIGTECAGLSRDEDLFCLPRTGAQNAPCRIEGTACNPGLVCRYTDGLASAPLCVAP